MPYVKGYLFLIKKHRSFADQCLVRGVYYTIDMIPIGAEGAGWNPSVSACSPYRSWVQIRLFCTCQPQPFSSVGWTWAPAASSWTVLVLFWELRCVASLFLSPSVYRVHMCRCRSSLGCKKEARSRILVSTKPNLMGSMLRHMAQSNWDMCLDISDIPVHTCSKKNWKKNRAFPLVMNCHFLGSK
jgi:hypothetical protein